MSNRQPRSEITRVDRQSSDRPSFNLDGGNAHPGYSQWVRGATLHPPGFSSPSKKSRHHSSHKKSKRSSRDRHRSSERRRTSHDRRRRSRSRGSRRSRSPRRHKSRGRSRSRSQREHSSHHRVRSSSRRRSHSRYSRPEPQRQSSLSSQGAHWQGQRVPLGDITNWSEGTLDRSERESDIEESMGQRELGNYAKRLANLDELLELNLKPASPKTKTAFGSYDQTPKLNLPAAEGFTDIMQDFMKEVKAEEGSKRAGANMHLPLDLARVPARHKPNMAAYRLAGNEWRTSACSYNSSLSSSSAFKIQSVPKAIVDQDRLRQWESSAREELTIASYSTWFLKGAREGLKLLQQKFVDMSHQEENGFSEEEWRTLWKATDNVNEFIDSAGKGVKSIAENSISDIGSMLLTRRDAWLGKLTDNKAITKQEMWDLRTTDLNEPVLFSQERLEHIHSKAEKRENENLQKNIWTGMFNKSKPQQKQNFQSRPPGRGNPSNPGTSQSRNPAPVFGRGGRGGRGGQNPRGRGRGGRAPETVTSTSSKSN